TLAARLVVVDGGKPVEVAPGAKQADGRITGGRFRCSTAATVQVEVSGGTPPLTVSVLEGATSRYDAATGTVTVSSMTPGQHTLTLRVQDGAPTATAQTYEEVIEL